MKRLVTVYDDLEPLNNVASALSLGADEVIFIYHHEASRNNFTNIEAVIRKYQPDTYIEFIRLDDDEKQIRKLLSTDLETIVDVGGAKYLSLLLFKIALESDDLIIYFDDEENVIKNYRDHSVYIEKVFALTIADILKLRGGSVIEYMHRPVKDEETGKIICRLVEENIDAYPAFVRYLGELNSIIKADRENNSLCYPLTKTQINRLRSDESYKRCKELFTIEDDTLVLRSGRLKELIGTSGAFLENYLYTRLNASGQFDEVDMSVVIDFSEDRYEHPVRCEIDCLVLKDNRVLMVSCKSSKAQTEDLNEIFVHNTMFGNALSAPVLCVGEELDHRYPSIYAKGEELGIYIVDKSAIKNKNIADVFTAILNGTYTYDVLY